MGAVVAVHRNGEKLSGKIGEIQLRAGDVLLVFGGKDFKKRTEGNQAFYSISEALEPENVNIWKVGNDHFRRYIVHCFVSIWNFEVVYRIVVSVVDRSIDENCAVA